MSPEVQNRDIKGPIKGHVSSKNKKILSKARLSCHINIFNAEQTRIYAEDIGAVYRWCYQPLNTKTTKDEKSMCMKRFSLINQLIMYSCVT